MAFKKIWNRTVGKFVTLWLTEDEKFGGVSFNFRFGGHSSQHNVMIGHRNNYFTVKQVLKENK